jgi:cell division initiation protein
MEISGRILREVEFRDRLRGYDTDEVDEFLEKVAVAVDELVAELGAVRDKLARHSETGVDDDSLRRTLVLAQRTADLAVREAREEAAALIEDARLEATALTADAREEAGRMRADAEGDVRAQIGALEARRVELKRQVEELEQTAAVERSRLSAALNAALASLGEATVAGFAATVAAEEPDDPAAPAVAGDPPGAGVEDEETTETPRVAHRPADEPPRRGAAAAFERGEDAEREDPPRSRAGRTLRAVEPDDDDPDELLWQRWARGADLDAVPIDHDPTVRPKRNHSGRPGSGRPA